MPRSTCRVRDRHAGRGDGKDKGEEVVLRVDGVDSDSVTCHGLRGRGWVEGGTGGALDRTVQSSAVLGDDGAVSL